MTGTGRGLWRFIALASVVIGVGLATPVARADVVSVTGRAVGVSALPLTGPDPQVSFTNPPDGPGPFIDSLSNYVAPATGQGAGGIVRASGISVRTEQVGTLGPSGAGVHSQADVSSAAFRIDELGAQGVHSECTATGTTASASSSFGQVFFTDANGPVFKVLPNYNPAPNTSFTLFNGLGTVTFNEQTAISGAQTGVAVNAIHLVAGALDIVVARSVCSVTVVPGVIHTSLSVTPDSSSGFAAVPLGYTYTESNDGTRPLTNVVVTDDNCSPVVFSSGDDDADGVLDPNETWFFRCTTTFPTGGGFTSNVTATGIDPVSGQSHVEQATTNVSIMNMPFWDEASGMWIDPSGNVCALSTAQVTLFRSARSGGTFEKVPSGSIIMSPDNRANPDTVRPDGSFRWDVVPGFYKIRLSTPATGESVDSSQFQIPPPVTGIALTLPCPTIPKAGVAAATRATLALTG